VAARSRRFKIRAGGRRFGLAIFPFSNFTFPNSISASSEFLRPLPRRVKHPQDFQSLTSHSVGNDIRRSRNHQLSRPYNPSRPAHGGILLEKIDGPQNP